MKSFKLAIIYFALLSSSLCYGTEPLPSFSSSYLVNEVISETKREHVFNFRNSSFGIFGGASYINEGNNFENSAYQIGGQSALSSGNLIRFWIRRVWMEETESTKLLSRTPFKQAAQMTRFEFHADFGYSIMEGRNISRIGPWFGDVEDGLYVTAGAHYSLPNKEGIPQTGNTPDPMPGQDAFNSDIVFNLGLLLQVHLASGFGVYYDYSYSYPISSSNSNLSKWQHFAWGIMWSFGD